jgi:hypothetical protein
VIAELLAAMSRLWRTLLAIMKRSWVEATLRLSHVKDNSSVVNDDDVSVHGPVI